MTTEDPGGHADHARGIVFGTSGGGSVTTEDPGRHADHGGGIVFAVFEITIVRLSGTSIN